MFNLSIGKTKVPLSEVKQKAIAKKAPLKAEEKAPEYEYEFPKVDAIDAVSPNEFENLYSEVTHGSYKLQH